MSEKGMASMTAAGTSQLSYCAARKRNTRKNAGAKSSGAWLPGRDLLEGGAGPFVPIDGGSTCAASVSIACGASLALNPGRGVPGHRGRRSPPAARPCLARQQRADRNHVASASRTSSARMSSTPLRNAASA